MTDPGDRPHLVTFQRDTPTVDDLGQQTGGWATYTTAWARVRYGTGQERREAAQEAAVMAATFECDWNSTLDGVTVRDRISFDGAFWDISSRVLIGDHRDIHFTATRTD